MALRFELHTVTLNFLINQAFTVSNHLKINQGGKSGTVLDIVKTNAIGQKFWISIINVLLRTQIPAKPGITPRYSGST